jgi:hypothetical protein
MLCGTVLGFFWGGWRIAFSDKNRPSEQDLSVSSNQGGMVQPERPKGYWGLLLNTRKDNRKTVS